MKRESRSCAGRCAFGTFGCAQPRGIHRGRQTAQTEGDAASRRTHAGSSTESVRRHRLASGKPGQVDCSDRRRSRGHASLPPARGQRWVLRGSRVTINRHHIRSSRRPTPLRRSPSATIRRTSKTKGKPLRWARRRPSWSSSTSQTTFDMGHGWSEAPLPRARRRRVSFRSAHRSEIVAGTCGCRPRRRVAASRSARSYLARTEVNARVHAERSKLRRRLDFDVSFQRWFDTNLPRGRARRRDRRSTCANSWRAIRREVGMEASGGFATQRARSAPSTARASRLRSYRTFGRSFRRAPAGPPEWRTVHAGGAVRREAIYSRPMLPCDLRRRWSRRDPLFRQGRRAQNFCVFGSIPGSRGLAVTSKSRLSLVQSVGGQADRAHWCGFDTSVARGPSSSKDVSTSASPSDRAGSAPTCRPRGSARRCCAGRRAARSGP